MRLPLRNLSILILSISALGLLAVYNASVAEAFADFNDKYYFAKQQLTWLFYGLVLYIIISNIPLKIIKKLAPVFFFLSLLLMVLVVIPGVGMKLQGARRWLNLGFINIQPSEIFKLSLLLYLSIWLEKKRGLIPFLSILFLSLILIMLQPDLGTAIIVGTSSFVVYYLSGAPTKELLVTLGLAIIVGTVLILSSPYRLNRVRTYLDPTTDPLGSSYHINQVILSLGSGGSFGVGLGRSIQKHAYLPEATTDSIFAVIAEELGFAGGVTIIFLYLIFTLFCLKLAIKTDSNFSKTVIGSIGCLVGIQSFVNLAAMVALVPLTGVPLPLISYGGSSLLSTFIAMGVMSSAAKNT